MMRNDHPYLTHFACLACRKVYKQPPTNRIYRRQGHKLMFSFERRNVICPQCGAIMVNMGRDFKAPKQDDIDQWAAVELLARHGITSGPRPTTLREAEAFVGKIKS